MGLPQHGEIVTRSKNTPGKRFDRLDGPSKGTPSIDGKNIYEKKPASM